MRQYLGKRLLQFIPVLLLAAVAVWSLLLLIPGSPATYILGDLAAAEDVAILEARLGLDRPAWERFGTWASGVVSGDLGDSYISGRSTVSLIADRIPATVQLAIFAIILMAMISIPLGSVAALKPNTWMGRLANGYMTITLAAPGFWIAFLMLLLLGVQLGWFPAVSNYVPIWEDPWAALRNAALPALAIGLNASAGTARFVRYSLTEVMHEDYIRTARAKGASERVVLLRHALRNAMLPTVTVIGLQLAALLTGAIIVEVVFTYPGLGRLLFSAISTRDFEVLQGTILFIVVVFLVLNLVVDFLYAYLDPRIRYN